ncbi:hypothetical protein LMH87_007371 [Akanthomyces muscarius]|uniref:Uncharacterized protein n=1 Tax=Akanthomyces muscarius TaxID=2231603 RepID=A0A9W8QPK0_AKAMU|nr:hypothetical protein LMH87_007371 [Akanthomyces muscarius]KAJ4165751.1 hypothetical protein LMH87_007371 [Akanthomyces muscarius]
MVAEANPAFCQCLDLFFTVTAHVRVAKAWNRCWRLRGDEMLDVGSKLHDDQGSRNNIETSSCLCLWASLGPSRVP